ncbi:hypothetical protein DSO57_1016161 [Entomophthora muscae]|uniref:Uncharacterized protein n=2 Tax=Entomophthora muscae TaxID=34485 RepID=A0ACC2U3F0_9FUNG|nr:hypothetical protein DSO57_1016161 [Entomophthora muscae]
MRINHMVITHSCMHQLELLMEKTLFNIIRQIANHPNIKKTNFKRLRLLEIEPRPLVWKISFREHRVYSSSEVAAASSQEK